MFVEAFKKILDATAPSEFSRQVELGQSPQAAWHKFEEAGFLDLMRTEEAGGAALPLNELYEICSLLGASATCLPLADTLIARLLIPQAICPDGIIALAPDCIKTDQGLQCTRVPFGAIAQYVLADMQGQMILLDAKQAQHLHASEWRSQTATFVWLRGSDQATCIPSADASSASALQAWGTALYAALMCGAMQKTFALTLEYCNDRQQFGRSLGKFQAIQHQFAVMAQHIVAASLATQAAFASAGHMPTLRDAAVAKARASEAALLVANTAHALHGAIGISDEYDLHLYTRRLHEWRLVHGSEIYWHEWLGKQAQSQTQTFCEFVQSF